MNHESVPGLSLSRLSPNSTCSLLEIGLIADPSEHIQHEPRIRPHIVMHIHVDDVVAERCIADQSFPVGRARPRTH